MSQRDFWSSYYGEVFEQGKPWLDLSNARVQAQTFGLALEAAGPVGGAACLDVGCGWGQLARALVALGARAVTATDIVASVVERHARDYPGVDWRCGELTDPAFCRLLCAFDRVFLVEVLQYVPVRETIAAAWEMLSPGGHMVGVVPNADCPIVQRSRSRFSGNYAPPTPAELAGILAALVGAEHWAMRDPVQRRPAHRALRRLSLDKRVRPRRTAAPPNRLMFIALKQSPPETA